MATRTSRSKIEVKPCADLEEFGQAVFAIGQYFGLEPTEERMERFAQNLPIERMHAARENGRIVGGAGAFPFEVLHEEAQLDRVPVGAPYELRVPEHVRVEELDGDVAGAQGDPVHEGDTRRTRIDVRCLEAERVAVEGHHRGEVVHEEVHLEEVHLVPSSDCRDRCDG